MERKTNIEDPYFSKLKMENEKDLKELEDQIKEETILQERKKLEYIDEIFADGESLVIEIEEKRKKESVKTEKSIFIKLIDFLFGF